MQGFIFIMTFAEMTQYITNSHKSFMEDSGSDVDSDVNSDVNEPTQVINVITSPTDVTRKEIDSLRTQLELVSAKYGAMAHDLQYCMSKIEQLLLADDRQTKKQPVLVKTKIKSLRSNKKQKAKDDVEDVDVDNIPPFILEPVNPLVLSTGAEIVIMEDLTAELVNQMRISDLRNVCKFFDISVSQKCKNNKIAIRKIVLEAVDQL